MTNSPSKFFNGFGSDHEDSSGTSIAVTPNAHERSRKASKRSHERYFTQLHCHMVSRLFEFDLKFRRKREKIGAGPSQESVKEIT